MNPLLFSMIFSLILLTSPSHANEQAQKMIQTTIDQVLSTLKQDKARLQHNPHYIDKIVDQYIVPQFDFSRMSRWVLGKYWRRANKQQQKQFIKEFQTLLVKTYTSALLQFTDETVHYLPSRPSKRKNRTVVRTEIHRSAGPKIAINYKMYKHKKHGWKIYDVKIEGISLVTNYRSSFSHDIRRSGMDYLIKKLHKKNQKSS